MAIFAKILFRVLQIGQRGKMTLKLGTNNAFTKANISKQTLLSQKKNWQRHLGLKAKGLFLFDLNFYLYPDSS